MPDDDVIVHVRDLCDVADVLAVHVSELDVEGDVLAERTSFRPDLLEADT